MFVCISVSVSVWIDRVIWVLSRRVYRDQAVPSSTHPVKHQASNQGPQTSWLANSCQAFKTVLTAVSEAMEAMSRTLPNECHMTPHPKAIKGGLCRTLLDLGVVSWLVFCRLLMTKVLLNSWRFKCCFHGILMLLAWNKLSPKDMMESREALNIFMRKLGN